MSIPGLPRSNVRFPTCLAEEVCNPLLDFSNVKLVILLCAAVYPKKAATDDFIDV